MNESTTEWRKAGRFSFWATSQNGNRMLVTRTAPKQYQVRINGELKATAYGKTPAMAIASTYAQV